MAAGGAMTRRRFRLHPAVRGFDRAAETYERGRPGYPAAAVRYVGRALGLGPGRTIVDLASGTGKLTRALRPLGAALLAVEPTAGMRRVFARTVPDVPVLNGTAEAMPLPDRFADAVVVGQAFHWFRAGPAVREIGRVVRPGGGIALLWNTRDDSVPFSRKLTEIQDRAGAAIAHRGESRWRARFDRARGPFGPIRQRTFHHTVPMDRATVVDRVLSVSAIAALPPARQRAVAGEVRRMLARDPGTAGKATVQLPYRTEVFTARRR